ncbi:hypothetical protein [Desulforegula conservatrix]|uniref:hypothetical protein n=1 Tax=Desulforegula conservatrix TaxID=153026 RepID=UPI00040FFDFD|nr:hypothetical protein [Desulforegula conservatrix]
MNGKTATTNWAFEKRFRKLYPEVILKPDRILTEEGCIDLNCLVWLMNSQKVKKSGGVMQDYIRHLCIFRLFWITVCA